MYIYIYLLTYIHILYTCVVVFANVLWNYTKCYVFIAAGIPCSASYSLDGLAKLLSYAGLFKSLESSLKYDESVPEHDQNTIHRRGYHGSRNRVTVNHTLIHSWISDFEAYQLRNPDECQRMIDKYDDAVGKYGYSLRHLRQVVPTLFLKDFLLDAAGEGGNSSIHTRGGGGSSVGETTETGNS